MKLFLLTLIWALLCSLLLASSRPPSSNIDKQNSLILELVGDTIKKKVDSSLQEQVFQRDPNQCRNRGVSVSNTSVSIHNCKNQSDGQVKLSSVATLGTPVNVLRSLISSNRIIEVLKSQRSEKNGSVDSKGQNSLIKSSTVRIPSTSNILIIETPKSAETTLKNTISTIPAATKNDLTTSSLTPSLTNIDLKPVTPQIVVSSVSAKAPIPISKIPSVATPTKLETINSKPFVQTNPTVVIPVPSVPTTNATFSINEKMTQASPNVNIILTSLQSQIGKQLTVEKINTPTPTKTSTPSPQLDINGAEVYQTSLLKQQGSALTVNSNQPTSSKIRK